MDILELDTRYVKASTKTPPKKARHHHEYAIIFKMSRIVRFDGSVSSEYYPFELPPTCVDCGHEKRSARKIAVRIEVPIREFDKLREARKRK